MRYLKIIFIISLLSALNFNQISANEESQEIVTFDSIYSISFENENETVGELTWDTGVMIFTGDADESAKVFFDYIKIYIDGCIEYKNE